jgi:disulfide bond formation protein DsbB
MAFALLAAFLAAAAPLIALGSETWPGLAPCALCLWQRWPYWAAAGIALLAAALPATARVWALRLAALSVLVSGAIAALHVGVEFGWWPSPLPACQVQSGGGTSVEDLMRSLSPTVAKPCDAPARFIEWLPVTVPQLNLLYAIGLAAFVWRGARRR